MDSSQQIAVGVERHWTRWGEDMESLIAPHFAEQRIRDPQFVERGGVLDAADSRGLAGQRREERHFDRIAIGTERERQGPLARVATWLGGCEQVHVADSGVVRI